MVSFVAIFGGILFFLVAGLVSYTLYLFYNKKPEQPRDSSIVHNKWMSQYTEGHAEGTLKRIIKGISRIGLVINPKDIDYLEHFDVGKGHYLDIKEKEIIFWIPKEKLHFHPRGTASDYKNIIEVEPLSVDDISEDMKNTRFGQIMMTGIKFNNENMSEKEFIKDELKKTQKILKGDWVGEITPEILERMNELSEERFKISFKDKDKKPSDYNSPKSGNYE